MSQVPQAQLIEVVFVSIMRLLIYVNFFRSILWENSSPAFGHDLISRLQTETMQELCRQYEPPMSIDL
jgi:hypothetical protein